MAKSKAFGGTRSMNTRERSELFVARRNKQQLISFLDVDTATLLAALNTALAAGATLSFAPAQGGIGCTVRVYRGDYADTEFAGSVEELEELLTLIAQGLSSSSEDVIQMTRLLLNARGESK